MHRLARSASTLLGSSVRSGPCALATDAQGLFDEMPPPPASPKLPRHTLFGHTCQVLGRTHTSGFCTVARQSTDEHASAEPLQFTVAPGDAFGPPVGMSEAAKMVCHIVSTQPEPRIASTLDALGVAMSPELVAEVLKNLSNAGC
jgi:hypothetical protein